MIMYQSVTRRYNKQSTMNDLRDLRALRSMLTSEDTKFYLAWSQLLRKAAVSHRDGRRPLREGRGALSACANGLFLSFAGT